MKNFSIQSGTNQAHLQICSALEQFLHKETAKPVFVCVGSDLLCGDSLGPLVGHFLTTRYKLDCFVYGTLAKNVTAKNVVEVSNFVKQHHSGQKVVAIDAALGRAEDVGFVRVFPRALYPAAALGKALCAVGNVSITAIVNRVCDEQENFLHYTRLSLVWKMAEEISRGIHLAYQNLYPQPASPTIELVG